MPEISRFLGIVITMLYEDHDPPHFHARYGEFEVAVFIEDAIFKGTFPRRQISYLGEWLSIHREELLEDWRRSREDRPLIAIPPLD